MNKTRTMPQSRKTPEISTSDAVDIVAKNVSEIAFVAVSSLVNVQPVWALIFLTAKGIYSAWGEFGQAKLNELVTDLEKAKNSFDPKVIETDEFKSVFLSALERHMKESSEMKLFNISRSRENARLRLPHKVVEYPRSNYGR